MDSNEFMTECLHRLTKDDTLICECDDQIVIRKPGYWSIELYKDNFLFTGSVDRASAMEVKKIIDFAEYIIAAVESYEE